MKSQKLCLVYFTVLLGCLGFITGAPPQNIEVNCGNIAKVPSSHFTSTVFSRHESATESCHQITCYITPHQLDTLKTLEEDPGTRTDTYPVDKWKDGRLGLQINNSIITLQTKEAVHSYYLPLILKTDDRDGTFTIDCIAPVVRDPDTGGLSAVYIALIVIIVLILLILAALIVAFFAFRKVKKFLRRKRNLQSVQGNSWPEFLDNNNENNGAVIGGTGYKSLDILNTDDHDLNRSRDLNQSDPTLTKPLILQIDSTPVSQQTRYNDDSATPPLYINLASPVHDLKCIPLSKTSSESPLSKNVQLSQHVPLPKSDSTSNYSNGKALHHIDQESTPLYIDAENQCRLIAPSEKLLSNGESDDEYSYTYVDTYIKSKPETKEKPVTHKPVPSVLPKPVPSVPAKPVPSVPAKPNIKDILQKMQSTESLTSEDNVPNSGSSTNPLLTNAVDTSALKQVDMSALKQVKLKPVYATPQKSQLNNGELTKPNTRNIIGNKTKPKPQTGNNIKPLQAPGTNEVTRPNPFAQLKHVGGKPPQVMQNNAGFAKPSSNGTPKKALMPPKTPFHLTPLHSIQQNNDSNRPQSELHYEDVQ